MSSPLDMLLNAVKSTIGDHATQQAHTGFDASALLSQVTQLFGQHQAQYGGPSGAPRPASEDPYGDPGANAPSARSVKPASADPYGDPGAQGGR